MARQTRLKVDLAGSQGSAGIAAAAQTDFDIQRNGTSTANIAVRDGVATASFIAAREIVLEPGDVLSEVAPATPDATLADVGYGLAGTLLLRELTRSIACGQHSARCRPRALLLSSGVSPNPPNAQTKQLVRPYTQLLHSF